MDSYEKSIRPSHPFGVKCRFDRARGEFVVHAGARAGAAAVVAVAALAVGSMAFVRSAFHHPTVVAAAPVPLASTTSRAPAPVITAHPQPAAVESKRPAVAVNSKRSHEYVRRPGLNYLVLETLPTKRAAAAAREALIRKGVATTVERCLPAPSGKSRYSLVGMTGFDKDRDAELFESQIKHLKTLKLDPKPYKWRGTEIASNTN